MPLAFVVRSLNRKWNDTPATHDLARFTRLLNRRTHIA